MEGACRSTCGAHKQSTNTAAHLVAVLCAPAEQRAWRGMRASARATEALSTQRSKVEAQAPPPTLLMSSSASTSCSAASRSPLRQQHRVETNSCDLVDENHLRLITRFRDGGSRALGEGFTAGTCACSWRWRPGAARQRGLDRKRQKERSVFAGVEERRGMSGRGRGGGPLCTQQAQRAPHRLSSRSVSRPLPERLRE